MNLLSMKYLKKVNFASLMIIFLIVTSMTAMLPLTTANGTVPEMLAPPLKTVPSILDCIWNVSSGEWDDAPEYVVARGVNVSYVRVKHDSDYLYVLVDSPFDVNRAVQFESETGWFAFDTGHDHGSLPQPDDTLFDTEFSAPKLPCHGHSVFWRGNGTLFWFEKDTHTAAGYLGECISGQHHTMAPSPHSSTPHRIDELRIPLAFVGSIGQTVGFYLMILDDKYDYDGSQPGPTISYVEWPVGAGGDSGAWPYPSSVPYSNPCPPPSAWGHLTLLTNALPPMASFSYLPPQPYVNATVAFDASASSDLDGRIVNYAWNFGDGNITVASDTAIAHTYSVNDTYTVTLNVTDNQGLWNTTSKNIPVALVPPPPYDPAADFTYSPSSAIAGKNVTFDAGASQPGWNGSHIMDLVNYMWGFGDTIVMNASVPVIKHIYAAGGSFTVNLTVTDAQGWSNSTLQTLTVSKASSQVSLNVNPVSITLGDQVSISVTISCDGQPKANVAPLIENRKAGIETWTLIGQKETNSTGVFSMSWKPTETGTFDVRGSWHGDACTNSAESELKTVTVTSATPAQEPIPIWEIAAIIAVVVAILAGTATYLLKKKRPKA